MSNKILKLYRGLSADEFSIASDKLLKENRKTWSSLLEYRADGDFDYPESLNQSITSLHKNLKLEVQYFTDAKNIAESYARKMDGLLVEMRVPLDDVINHFDIEFQNFSRRKKQFEIVYRVKGSLLSKYKRKWRLSVRRLK